MKESEKKKESIIPEGELRRLKAKITVSFLVIAQESVNSFSN
jgi:hypothetical protein